MDNGNHSRPHLAYVEWFEIIGGADPDTNMFLVKKERASDGSGTRIGGIIELEDIVQPCPLSPKFGENAQNLDQPGAQVTGLNCLDLVETFRINPFHSKPGYQTIF
ncbi:hypothetical protein K439DRAFT_1621296 [Ramaria rubella]|nr:hypothetical protein K439DRAFT_1621296 [Ramaria rubella]